MLIACYATWLQVHMSGTKIKEYITLILGCVKELVENESIVMLSCLVVGDLFSPSVCCQYLVVMYHP